MAAAVALAGAARSGSPRARRPAGPVGSVPHQPGGMTMKTTIAIALLAVGAFLTFAVNIHPGVHQPADRRLGPHRDRDNRAVREPARNRLAPP
jgi:hypothetical protein